MVAHPDLMMVQIRHRQREMIAEADRMRLLAAARRSRRRAGSPDPDGSPAPDGAADPAARGRPDGTLAACDPRVAAPAR